MTDNKYLTSCRLQRIKEEREQKIAILEEAKAAIEGEVGELRVNLREVEKSHMEARRELQELRREVAYRLSHGSVQVQEYKRLMEGNTWHDVRKDVCKIIWHYC